MLYFPHMTPLALAASFVFGTVIGSFANAVIWRLRTGETVVRGRSYCPSCRTTLSASDLIPLLSWLLLRGRCRYCEKEIGAHYPAVELAMGALFLAAAWASIGDFGYVLGGDAFVMLLLRWYLCAVLLIVFVFDLRYMLILRKVTVPATVIAAVANLALGTPAVSLLLGMALGWGFFMAQILVSKGRWVGGGDAWLGLLMGAALGWPMVGVALFIAYIAGALVGSVLLVLKKAEMQSQLPFGTFLAASTVLTMLAGDRILGWYLTLLT
jgi:prepilin signal peptidase PulO-like enzyme (type II secretory pathway)